MKKTYQVDGMKCEGCAKTVRETLAQVVGVTEVTVDLNKKTATVTGDASRSNGDSCVKRYALSFYLLSDKHREESK